MPNYTWHHHQDLGRMQLVQTKFHGKTGHLGGDKMSQGR
ncbi:HNH endonuclease [Escherichia marmotae]